MTRSQCKVSDTQVTVKACGPLVLPAAVEMKGLEAVVVISFLLVVSANHLKSFHI